MEQREMTKSMLYYWQNRDDILAKQRKNRAERNLYQGKLPRIKIPKDEMTPSRLYYQQNKARILAYGAQWRAKKKHEKDLLDQLNAGILPAEIIKKMTS